MDVGRKRKLVLDGGTSVSHSEFHANALRAVSIIRGFSLDSSGDSLDSFSPRPRSLSYAGAASADVYANNSSPVVPVSIPALSLNLAYQYHSFFRARHEERMQEIIDMTTARGEAEYDLTPEQLQRNLRRRKLYLQAREVVAASVQSSHDRRMNLVNPSRTSNFQMAIVPPSSSSSLSSAWSPEVFTSSRMKERIVEREKREKERQLYEEQSSTLQVLISQLEEVKVSQLREKKQKELEAAVQARITGGQAEANLGLDVLLDEIIIDEIASFKSLLPLTSEETALAISLMSKSSSSNEVIVDKFNIEIKASDMSTLKKGGWLNDEIMNFYMKLLQERNSRNLNSPYVPDSAKMACYMFNTFLCAKFEDGAYDYNSVKRWSKKANVTLMNLDLAICPVNVGKNHWCCAVINIKQTRIEYYDSMGGSNPALIASLKRYVTDEAKTYSNLNVNASAWEEYTPRDIPQQNNGSDCGVFTLKFAECLSEGKAFNFTAMDMAHIRNKIALEIKFHTVL